jgi:hypothetical protein
MMGSAIALVLFLRHKLDKLVLWAASSAQFVDGVEHLIEHVTRVAAEGVALHGVGIEPK